MAIPALVAALGVPLLARILGGGLARIDHPAAKGAAEALEGFGHAVEGREIDTEALARASDRLAEVARIEAERDSAILKQVNRTVRAEVASEDAYVRRWRPTFGYAVAITWTLQMAGLTYAVVATPALAGEILAAMTHLSVIWGVALSVLGVTVAKRSQDKALLDKTQLAQAGSGLELLGRKLGKTLGMRDSI